MSTTQVGRNAITTDWHLIPSQKPSPISQKQHLSAPTLLPLPLPLHPPMWTQVWSWQPHWWEQQNTENPPLLGQALSCAYVSGAREFPAWLSQRQLPAPLLLCKLLLRCPTQGAADLLSFPKKDHPQSRTSACLGGNLPLSLAGVYEGYLPVCTANTCPNPSQQKGSSWLLQALALAALESNKEL